MNLEITRMMKQKENEKSKNKHQSDTVILNWSRTLELLFVNVDKILQFPKVK